MSDFDQQPPPFSSVSQPINPQYGAPPIDVAAPSAGLSDNAAGALAYVTIIPAIIFLLIEPYNRRPFVRFHAAQCLGLAVCWFVCGMTAIIPILGWIIAIVSVPIFLVCWLLCIVKASQGKMFKLPLLGDFVQNLVK